MPSSPAKSGLLASPVGIPAPLVRRAVPPYRMRACMAALAMAMSAPSWAGNGGTGSSFTVSSRPFGGAGGTNGDASQANGQDAPIAIGGTSRRGGGGGATNITTGFGGSGGMSVFNNNPVAFPPGATGSAGAVDISVVTGAIAGQAGGVAASGVAADNGGGGGGGGVGVTTSKDIVVTNGGSVTGGVGGGVPIGPNSSGGAGGGGAGLFSTANVTVQAGASVTGGAGGAARQFGGGGGGGVGVVLGGTGTLSNAGTLAGGAGGNAVSGAASAGQGGSGGEGVWISDGGTLVNVSTGTIAGGAAASVTSGDPQFAPPDGGAGVVGTNATVVNAGTITAGVRADAIRFIGGVNSLELQAGSTINGNVAAFSAADTLKLGGNADAGFDLSAIGAGAQYQGFGHFEKTGGSTWTLNGTSTQAMPWTVGQGTLAVAGSMANSSFLVNAPGALAVDGTVADSTITANGGTVTIAASGSVTNTPFALNAGGTLNIDGTIAGSAVTIAGGTVNLAAGGSAINSPFTVNGGGLLVANGPAGTSAVVVNSGGTLRGSGTVGATTVRSGGVIAPGNSIGTLTVNGAYVQEAGSVYQAEVDPTSSASDRIAVAGTATIQNGASIDVIKTTPAPFVAGTRYTVLSAAGGVAGTFNVTGDTSLSPFLNLVGTYDPGNAYLEVKQTRSIGDVATTPNQAAVASGLDSLPAGAAAAVPVVNQQSDDAARMALDQLSGEIHASVQSAMLESSRFTRDAVTDRLTGTFTCPAGAAGKSAEAGAGGTAPGTAGPGSATACGAAPRRPAGWARFYGNWGHTDGDGNASRLGTSLGGFFIGVDMPVAGDWRAGVLAGYSHGSYRVSGGNASAESDDYHMGVYGGAQWGALGFRSGATYTWHDIDADRSLAVPGFSDRLSSNYNAGTAQAFGELGYKLGLGERASVEPFLNLAYVNQHAQGFTERGGADALHVRSQDMDTGFSTLGLRGTTHFTFNGTDYLLKAMVGWRYAVGDVRPVATESFQGGSSFDISGVPIARNQAVVDLGVGVHITRNATISLSYNGQFASRVNNQGVLGGLNIAF